MEYESAQTERKECPHRGLIEVQPLRGSATAISKEIHAGTYEFPSCEDDPLMKEYPTKEDAARIWNLELKEERMAVMGNITDDIMYRAHTNRTEEHPYGLVNMLANGGYEWIDTMPSNQPFLSLNNYMNDTITKATIEEFQFLRTFSQISPSTPVAKIYRRYQQWIDFFNTYFGPTTEEERIIDAARVGNDSAAQILELIPETYQRDIPEGLRSPELYAQVARNSYPLLHKISSPGFVLFSALQQGFTRNARNVSLTASDVEIIKRNTGQELSLRPHVYERAHQHSMTPNMQTALHAVQATGCVTRTGLDGKASPLKLYWNWQVDIAREIYHKESA